MSNERLQEINKTETIVLTAIALRLASANFYSTHTIVFVQGSVYMEVHRCPSNILSVLIVSFEVPVFSPRSSGQTFCFRHAAQALTLREMDGAGSDGLLLPSGDSDAFSALLDAPLDCDQVRFDIVLG
jgi:hypothetical protein